MNTTMSNKALPIVGTEQFLQKLTGGRLSTYQVNRAGAYLRAKGISFYDDWSREHCMLMDKLNENKLIVIEALRLTLNVATQ